MATLMKVAHPVDAHVGQKIRTLRRSQGRTQTEMAAAIGLTFQQVQKYERGANRISASKLHEIAEFLKVPVTYFYEGYGQTENEEVAIFPLPAGHTSAFLETSEGMQLALVFPRIVEAQQRRRLLDLINALAEAPEELPNQSAKVVTADKHALTSRLQRQLASIEAMPRRQQKIVGNVIDTFIARYAAS